MINDVWINLPVKDIKKSVAFFTAIGFKINSECPGNSETAGLILGNKSIALMLFTEPIFNKFLRQEKVESTGSEVIFSIGVDSKEDIDELAEKVRSAGGKIFSEPKEEQGWMYGCGFSDLDGHKWNGLFMDMTKMSGKSVN